MIIDDSFYTGAWFLVKLPPAPEGVLDIDIRMALNSFLAALAATGASEKTLNSYRSGIMDFIEYSGVRRLRDLNAGVILEWINHRLRYGFERERKRDVDYKIVRRRRQVTMHYYTMFLRKFIEWAGLDKKIVPVVRKPRSIGVEALGKEEIAKLLSAARDLKDLAILSLLFETGLRASELLSLRVRDVDLSRGEVVVRSGKYGKERTVFLGPLSRRVLEKIITGKRSVDRIINLSYNGLYKRLKSIAKRAGVPPYKVRPHVLRHSFATEALRSGVSLPVLQKLMGHSDIKTTQIYMHLVKEDLEREYKVFADSIKKSIYSGGGAENKATPTPPSGAGVFRFCPYCGSKLPAGAKFCPYCGSRLAGVGGEVGLAEA